MPRLDQNTPVELAAPRRMNERVFLHKYRVTIDETDPVADSPNNPSSLQGVEVESGQKVLVEMYPARSLSPNRREQLRSDALAAKQLRHPNIPVLYDFAIENDELLYVSEHFDGTLAEKWVRDYGPMPVSPVLFIASQVVSALTAAAFHRVVHQDISPRNLLLIPGQTAEGEWPLVKVLRFTGSAPSRQNGATDFRSAMYSLGATMWFLLTGAPPPAIQNEQGSRPGASVEKLRGVPKSVRGLLGRMLSPDPAERPGDPVAFSRLLQETMAHLQGPEATSRTPATPSRARKDEDDDKPTLDRKRVLIVVAAAAVILASVGIAMFGFSRPRQTVTVHKPKRNDSPIVGAPVTTRTPAAIATKTDTNANHPAPAKSAGRGELASAPRVETDYVQRAAINMTMPPTWPKTLLMFRPPRPPEAAYVIPSSLAGFSETINASKISTMAQVEVPTTSRARETKITDSPRKKVATGRSDSVSPEVRRGEAAPPAEGPVNTSRLARGDATRPTPAPLALPNETERPIKAKRKAEERLILPTPAR